MLLSDQDLVAFNDINPKAPTHILIVPKKHIPTINDLSEEDAQLISKMIYTAKSLAQDKNIDQSGYRLIFNVRENAGQEVNHIHLHLIGGKKLSSMA